MFDAVRPYGSRGLPITQDEQGRIVLSGDQEAPSITVDVNIPEPAPRLIFPNPPCVQNTGAVPVVEGDFQLDDNAIKLSYIGNLGDDVEMVGIVHGDNPSPGIYRSTDNGATWAKLASSGGDMRIGQVYSTGKSLLNVAPPDGGSRRTEIWHSNTLDSNNPANWTKVVETNAGYFSDVYGQSIKDNVVIFTSYGDKDALNPPRFMYLSRDYGASFVEIEVCKIADMPDPSTFHLHDVEYDPYADRIWVSNGDQTNGTLQYSDDWGASWTVLDRLAEYPKQQPTSIVALPDRVLLSSDNTPDGIHAIIKDPANPKKPVSLADVEHLYLPSGERSGSLIHVANNSKTRTSSQIDVYPYCFLSVLNGSGGGGVVRLVASPDGKQFYTIFSEAGSKMLSGSLFGPVSNDPDRWVYHQYYDRIAGVSMTRKFKFPEWVEAG